MGLCVDQMRKYLNDLYGGNWTALYSMPDDRIRAIYFTELRRGDFDKKKKAEQMEQKKKEENKPSTYYQMTLLDWLLIKEEMEKHE